MGVDFAYVGTGLQMGANGFDAAAFDPNVGAGEDALTVEYTGTANDESGFRRRGGSLRGVGLGKERRRDGGSEGQSGSECECRGEWQPLMLGFHAEIAPFESLSSLYENDGIKISVAALLRVSPVPAT
jgi:hypothetical protein